MIPGQQVGRGQLEVVLRRLWHARRRLIRIAYSVLQKIVSDDRVPLALANETRSPLALLIPEHLGASKTV